MLLLLWNFYSEVVSYDPLADVETAAAGPAGETMEERRPMQAWGREIVDRNLFSSARRNLPPPPPAPVFEFVEEPEPPKERPSLKLNGIIRDQFGEYVAYVQRGSSALPPLRKGDRMEDLLVVDIGEREVVLEWEGEEIKLNMTKVKTLKF